MLNNDKSNKESPPKILIVDDDPSTVFLVENCLKDAGFQTQSLKDGLDALQYIHEYPPALIVLDIVMPEINGYDICHHLRFQKELKNIPIVILSERDQELGSSVLDQVNITYLKKPFDPQILLKTVYGLMSS